MGIGFPWYDSALLVGVIFLLGALSFSDESPVRKRSLCGFSVVVCCSVLIRHVPPDAPVLLGGLLTAMCVGLGVGIYYGVHERNAVDLFLPQ
ncbi:hypothetical protein [Halocatena halophila]|uniref:hypothetical protein n=1 Tax=Halocatena halophila TaxID=2814576 RepID=UPI002ED15F69